MERLKKHLRIFVALLVVGAALFYIYRVKYNQGENVMIQKTESTRKS